MVTVPDLDFGPRTKGRASVPLSVSFVRELGPADLALLASERGIKAPVIVRIRDRHHALARVLAQGMTNTEASLVTGYDPSRISILLSDPTFKQLVDDYKKVEAGLMADFMDRATTLSLSAMDRLQDIMEDEESPPSATVTLEIAKFAADRTGHAPIQKNLNLNANVGVASRLQAARARLRAITDTPSQEIVDADFRVVEPASND